MHISIINGPNLNLLGKREPEWYGTRSFDSFLPELMADFPDHRIDFFQSNDEGALIDRLQADGFSCDGILINAGGYTHTSVALGDTIAAIACPVVEVHISHPLRRETFRHVSYLSPHCIGLVSGFGLASYHLALNGLLSHLSTLGAAKKH
ncbi:MAG: type II 3-dehydroquinate dehydratase [Bacteroidia bacterium]|jgi:3-dehydroquinate dehydratase-2